MKLLTTNAKLDKRPDGSDGKVRVLGLALAPHTQSGHNVCPHAGYCAEICNLWFAGRTVTRPVRNAMIERTRLFFEDRLLFKVRLFSELHAARRSAKRAGERLYVRLNTASDIAWERVFPDLFLTFSDVSFYDYTKDMDRALRCARPPSFDGWPKNYELTYSYNERSRGNDVHDLLEHGGNVAVVFDTEYIPGRRMGKLPSWWTYQTCTGREHSVQVIDGDKHDIRRHGFDSYGVCVGLRGKGGKKRVREGVESGFIQVANKVGV